MAVNVNGNYNANNLSRNRLLKWINKSLKCELIKVEHLCTGAAYCQIMHKLFPETMPLKRVHFLTNKVEDFKINFKLLEKSFKINKVDKVIPVSCLVEGRFATNLEFLQWFKKFFDANYKGQKYDALKERDNEQLAYGSFFDKRKKSVQHPYKAMVGLLCAYENKQKGVLASAAKNSEALCLPADVSIHLSEIEKITRLVYKRSLERTAEQLKRLSNNLPQQKPQTSHGDQTSNDWECFSNANNIILMKHGYDSDAKVTERRKTIRKSEDETNFNKETKRQICVNSIWATGAKSVRDDKAELPISSCNCATSVSLCRSIHSKSKVLKTANLRETHTETSKPPLKKRVTFK